MLSVALALEQVLAAIAPLGIERIPVQDAVGRTLAETAVARVIHPPHDLAAMDGYALHADDLTTPDGEVRCVGTAVAGRGFDGAVEAGRAVRIFTGAPVPNGAAAVVIQEDVEHVPDGGLRLTQRPAVGANIRRRGLDFTLGQSLLASGQSLRARDIALLAAMNYGAVAVQRRPRVAILSIGDELCAPGQWLDAAQIPNSCGPALAALAVTLGATVVAMDRAPDEAAAITAWASAAAAEADLLLTIGGASVGDRDLTRPALIDAGMRTVFWKVAMQPGKPVSFGVLDATPVFALPGNPVSALVCAVTLVAPALARLSGLAADAFQRPATACSAIALPATGSRQLYLRAMRCADRDGPRVRPHRTQDSALLSVLAAADCLIVRPPLAPAAPEGAVVSVLDFPSAVGGV